MICDIIQRQTILKPSNNGRRGSGTAIIFKRDLNISENEIGILIIGILIPFYKRAVRFARKTSLIGNTVYDCEREPAYNETGVRISRFDRELMTVQIERLRLMPRTCV